MYIAMVVMAMMASCQKEGVDETVTDTTASSEIKKHVTQKFIEAGVNPILGVHPFVMDGVKGWTGGDIFLSQEDVAKTTGQSIFCKDKGAKLFRTKNIVKVTSKNRTINIIGRTSLTKKMRGALRQAIKNYNNLSLKIRFSLTIGDDTKGNQMVVRTGDTNGSAAVAQFPTDGGNPGITILVLKDINVHSEDILTHVFMHEIGHATGLRHSDFRSRQSCENDEDQFHEGGPDDEEAIHIPGTDTTGRITNFVMRACTFDNDEGKLIW